jgi:two-component system NtrC family sensor kinase
VGSNRPPADELAGVATRTGAAASLHRGRRLQTLQQHVEHTNRIQRLALRVQRSLAVPAGPAAIADGQLIDDLHVEVSELRASGLSLDPATDSQLARLDVLLDDRGSGDSMPLTSAVALVNQIVDSETAAQSALWRRIDADTRLELGTVILLSVTLPLIVLFAAVFVRRRILSPLNELKGLLSRLADGDFTAWQPEQIHPALMPVIANYNHLVTRLEALEEEHRLRASSLEAEVRSATEALLEQQSTLARAERLAAVGVTTASLAHELRNPLAGVLMSLGNLRREASDADTRERLDLVIAEIERLARLLNSTLSAAHHTPEPSRSLELRELVTNLLALIRYQIPEHIELVSEVPDRVECSLPRDRLRQALLNLVLNSVRAIGVDPGRVVISADQRDGRIEITVDDDGPGFPDELLAAGIRPFTSRISGGTGLGLAMVRRLAADLGGEVHLSNLEPRGARVRLVVPCSDV